MNQDQATDSDMKAKTPTEKNRKPTLCVGGKKHKWIPVTLMKGDHAMPNLNSFPHGGNEVRCVCMGCHAESYFTTVWAGYKLDEI